MVYSYIMHGELASLYKRNERLSRLFGYFVYGYYLRLLFTPGGSTL